MRTGKRRAAVFVVAVMVAAGILFHPGDAAATRILKDDSFDAKAPAIEPEIQAADPGEDPHLDMLPLGSALGTGVDADNVDIPRNEGLDSGAGVRLRLEMIYSYLIGIASGVSTLF